MRKCHAKASGSPRPASSVTISPRWPPPATEIVVVTLTMDAATYGLAREQLDEVVTEFDIVSRVWRR